MTGPSPLWSRLGWRRNFPQRDAAAVFSANAAIGFLGMALGALLAGGVHLLSGPLGMMLAYKSLFLLSMVGSVLAFIFISSLHEPKNKKSHPGPARRQAERAIDRDQVAGGKNRAENRMLGRLIIANTLNELGIGMIAPLIAYWFALRFRHGPGSIRPAPAGSFLWAPSVRPLLRAWPGDTGWSTQWLSYAA